jgi:hypothetical protein
MLTGWKERLAKGKRLTEKSWETDVSSEKNNQEFIVKYWYTIL